MYSYPSITEFLKYARFKPFHVESFVIMCISKLEKDQPHVGSIVHEDAKNFLINEFIKDEKNVLGRTLPESLVFFENHANIQYLNRSVVSYFKKQLEEYSVAHPFLADKIEEYSNIISTEFMSINFVAEVTSKFDSTPID